MTRRWVTVCAVLLVSMTRCAAPAPKIPEVQTMSPRLSEGRIEGLSSLYVDANAFADALRPAEGTTEDPPTSELRMENLASARVEVAVNGTKLGLLGPYAVGVLHGVPAGRYDVGYTLPNGYTRLERVPARAME